MTQATAYGHIVIDEVGVPLIEGTTTKVVELVLDVLAYGWSPDEIHFQHPHLTLGQIHSALAYYWDHQDELDQELARQPAMVGSQQRRTPHAPPRARLQSRGLL